MENSVIKGLKLSVGVANGEVGMDSKFVDLQQLFYCIEEGTDSLPLPIHECSLLLTQKVTTDL